MEEPKTANIQVIQLKTIHMMEYVKADLKGSLLNAIEMQPTI